MCEDLQVGDKISGKIIALDDTSVFIDTGSKIDGMEGILAYKKASSILFVINAFYGNLKRLE
jgi:ribosomal protein S1